jgi:hypothetical protein
MTSYDWWAVAIDGGTPVKTGAGGVFRQRRLAGPVLPGRWRADGNGVIFSARSGDAQNLWLVAISPKTWKAVGVPRQLTFGAGLEVQPSAAGGRLAFSVLSENTNVWSLPVDANGGKAHGEIVRLTESGDRDMGPSVAGDGTKMAFSRGSWGQGNLWLKDLRNGKDKLLATAVGGGLIAPDGSKVTYAKFGNQTTTCYVVPSNGGEAETVCQDCRTLNGWSQDGKNVLYEALAERAIVLVDVASGHKTEVLKHPKYGLSRGRFSPDDRWISFHWITPNARRIFVAAYHGATEIPESQWIPITDGQAMDRYASWSPDGNLLYFLSERDGFRCIWAQRVDSATKHPSGTAFPVHHFHTSRRSLMTLGDPLYTGFSVAVDKLVFSMTERTGNIWMTNLP